VACFYTISLRSDVTKSRHAQKPGQHRISDPSISECNANGTPSASSNASQLKLEVTALPKDLVLEPPAELGLTETCMASSCKGSKDAKSPEWRRFFGERSLKGSVQYFAWRTGSNISSGCASSHLCGRFGLFVSNCRSARANFGLAKSMSLLIRNA